MLAPATLQQLLCTRLLVQSLVPFLKRVPLDVSLPVVEGALAALPREWLSPALMYHFFAFLREEAERLLVRPVVCAYAGVTNDFWLRGTVGTPRGIKSRS